MEKSGLLFAKDFVRLRTTKEPRFSPDGRRVAFVVESVDSKKNGYRSSIHVFDVETESDRVFTSGTRRDFSPKWSPDGSKLGFLSSRNGSPNVFVMPTDGGEAQQVTFFPKGVRSFVWHPSGKQVVVLASMTKDVLDEFLREEEDEELNAVFAPVEVRKKEVEREEKEKLRSDPLVVKDTIYRQNGSYTMGARGVVFLVDLEKKGKDAVSLLTSLDMNVMEIGEVNSDGSWVPGVRLDLSSDDPFLSFYHEVIRIGLDGRVEVLGRLLRAHGVQVSRDGRLLSVLGLREGEEFGVHDIPNLFVLDVESGDVRLLSESIDRGVMKALWGDENWLYFVFADSGKAVVARVDVRSGVIERVFSPEFLLNDFDVSGGEVVFDGSEFNDPAFIGLVGSDRDFRVVFSANRELLDSLVPIEVHERWFERDGFKIQSWLLLPAGMVSSEEKLPVVLEMHGGPSAMWSPHERTMWHEFRSLLSEGFAVCFSNPRGSSGYGREFMTAVVGDWGDGPAEDIMMALHRFLDEFSVLDRDRVVVTGGSYAGFMTAWLATHYAEFKAAVAQRGVYEFLVQSTTCDIPLWMMAHVNVDLWEDVTAYWDISPVKYAKDLSCPLLLIHAENDFRVPIANAEALFFAGKRFGKTIELVRYPREEHELSRSGEPRHRIDRIQRIIDWFKKYV